MSLDRPLAARVEQLITALGRETSLMTELGAALARQRDDVARSDVPGLESDVAVAGRIMLTLQEAGRLRGSVLLAMGVDREQPLAQLAATLPPPLAARLEAARVALAGAAAQATREAGISARVLRSAIHAGDAYLQALFTGPFVTPYAPADGRGTPPARAGVLVDKVA